MSPLNICSSADVHVTNKNSVLLAVAKLAENAVSSLSYTCSFGVCTPYVINPGQPSYCDPFYTVGVDHFYLPNNRAGGSVYNLNAFIIRGKFTIDVIRQPCK